MIVSKVGDGIVVVLFFVLVFVSIFFRINQSPETFKASSKRCFHQRLQHLILCYFTRKTERKNLFKKIDIDHGRRRREETSVQLRKQKKDLQLAKRRQTDAPALANTTNNNVSIGNNNESIIEIGRTYTIDDIPRLMAGLRSGDPAVVLEAVRGFRKMLSVAANPPVNEIIDAGALPFLVGYLWKPDHPEIMFEASWAVTNIASTDRTKDVFEAGATSTLIQLLLHEQANIREQAAWCLGNIAGDCHEYRDHLLRTQVLSGL